MLIDVVISGDRSVIKKEAEKILKLNTAHVECKNKGDNRSNRGDWEYFRVIQKIREQHIGEIMKSSNYRKQPYRSLHTYCGKC